MSSKRPASVESDVITEWLTRVLSEAEALAEEVAEMPDSPGTRRLGNALSGLLAIGDQFRAGIRDAG